MYKEINYQVESFTAILDEIKELVPQHGIDAEISDLNVDFDKFTSIDKSGNLLCLCARRYSTLVGYVIGIATTDLHRRHIKQIAFQDYYVKAEFRPQGIAIRLFKEVELLLSKTEIVEMHVDSKMKYDKLFELLGWYKTGHIYSKGIEHV